MQSKTESLAEAIVNSALGWSINFCANLVVLPAFGFPVTVHDAVGIGIVFTGISVARSYVIRRWFNARLLAVSRALARRIEG